MRDTADEMDEIVRPNGTGLRPKDDLTPIWHFQRFNWNGLSCPVSESALDQGLAPPLIPPPTHNISPLAWYWFNHPDRTAAAPRGGNRLLRRHSFSDRWRW